MEVLHHLHEHPLHRDRPASRAATTRSTSTLLQRDHATVETDGVRTAKAMGLREPSLEGLAGQQGLGPRGEHRRRPHRLGPPPRPP